MTTKQTNIFFVEDIMVYENNSLYNTNYSERFEYIKKLMCHYNENVIFNDIHLVHKEFVKINNLIEELRKIYQSFGYNNIKIDFTYEIFENNSSDVFLEFDEGKITKIKNIYFKGNSSYENDIILSKIKSKSKKITNIFANNNFKPIQVQTDRQRLLNFYKDKGYADIDINYNIEFFDNNSVVIYFNITEGSLYEVGEINYSNNIQDININDILDNYLETAVQDNSIYNISLAENIEKDIADIIKNSGTQFFEIKKRVNLNSSKADLLFEIKSSR